MMDLMRLLEPRHDQNDSILFRELEDVNEIIFYTHGKFEIGYEF